MSTKLNRPKLTGEAVSLKRCSIADMSMFVFCHGAQGQGVLSDKLRSFSMQDLTLINADDELALHTSDPRTRRDAMDEMSSGASTLPRARSTAARQSKAICNAKTHTHSLIFMCMHTMAVLYLQD